MIENTIFVSSSFLLHQNSNFNSRTLVGFSQNSEIKVLKHISKPTFHEVQIFLSIDRMDRLAAPGGTADYENKGRLK